VEISIDTRDATTNLVDAPKSFEGQYV